MCSCSWSVGAIPVHRNAHVRVVSDSGTIQTGVNFLFTLRTIAHYALWHILHMLVFGKNSPVTNFQLKQGMK